MDQRALNAGLTREEVMAALVALGEDPTASRVAALHARIDANSLSAGGREEAVRGAVDAARRVSDAVPAARPDSGDKSSTLAGRLKVGDVVYPRGLHLRGRIVEEDTLNDSSPRIPGEKLWILRFDDGRSGGGWRDGELEKVPSKKQFSVTWDETFVKPGTKVVGAEFFSNDSGYYDDEIGAIQALAIGQTWQGSDYSNGHTVTRQPDLTNSLDHIGSAAPGDNTSEPMPTADEVRDLKTRLAEERLARRLQSATSIAASDSALRDHRAVLQRIEKEHSVATAPACGSDESPSPDM